MAIIYKEIHQWSKQRPLWQRDALRRLVIQNQLSDEDIDQLVDFCKSDHGLVDKSNLIQPVPLELQHIPLDVEGSKGSILTKISDIHNVNALIPSQVLEFLPKKGLTIIYGDNGSGKTGFVRILKRVCRTRGSEGIVLNNVFDDSSSSPPSATIHFYNENQNFSLPWSEDSTIPTPIELSSVAVFDRHAAAVYVDKESEIIWLPGGLDLFSKLVDTCQKVASILKKELEYIEDIRINIPEIPQETEVHSLIENLSINTLQNEIIRLANLSQEEEKLVQEITKEIARIETEDPAKISQSIKRQISRFKDIVERFDNIETLFSNESINDLKKIKEEVDNKIYAADFASTEAFKSDPLHGVGSETWRELWEAAKRYSEKEAYKNIPFPVVKQGARCVLCQQELSLKAQDRIIRFSEFVKQDIQKKADIAKKTLSEKIKIIDNVILKTDQDDNLIEELKDYDEDLACKVSDCFRNAEKRRSTTIMGCETNNWVDIPNYIGTPKEELCTLLKKLDNEASNYEKMDVTVRKAELNVKLKNLQARLVLRDYKEQIFEEIERLKKIEKYKSCIRDTDTTGITRKNTELTIKVVTEALCNKFSEEIRSLGLETLSVVLEPSRGEGGVSKYHIMLKTNSKEHSPQGVVSEGEYRCIALASFLAEATSTENVSSLVFDDPVSSLDHIRKERISKRLIEEARQRQVIIFTHDLAFLLYLQEYIDRYGVDVEFRHICHKGPNPGLCKNVLPWGGGMNTKQRIGFLKQEWQQIEKAFRNEDSVTYNEKAKLLYNHLRETWECAVEEVFLNGTVRRLNRSVETQRLKKVVEKDLKSYYERLDSAMDKCSTWTGHTQASEINAPIPKPNEINKDIEELDNWVRELR